MRKSGLHKQISSIFDGVPVPQNNDVLEDADSSSEQVQSVAQEPTEPQGSTEAQGPTEPQGQPDPVSVPEPEQTQARSSLVKRMSADPSECASAPAIQIDRPMPLAKSSVMSAKTGPSLISQVKKAVFGSHKGSLDARQKKMAALVGVLCLVFGAVMFISLGGVGQTKAMAADDASGSQTIQSHGTKKTAQDWTNPQPLPAEMRDATSPVFRQTGSTEGSTGASASGGLVVKGIVFSKNKPSAIINNEIMSEGESFNGVTIVKISKEGVEFEANEKRWTQQVQR